MQLKPLLRAPLLAAALVSAHPGHEEKLATRDLLEYKAHLRRGLSTCAATFEETGLTARAIARRAQITANYRAKRHLAKRDTDDVLDTSHLSTENYTLSTAESDIFSGSSTCVLNPEGETGPFWVNGELIRTDILEDQPGVPVVLEYQFVDVSTCQPLANIYADTWSCNATGVYSGVQGNGNGDSSDDSILSQTFLRGVGKTDEEGVVTFNTLFPGHYSGRTTHHHIIVHLNATLLSNNTLTGGSVPHIGQLFWDQDLIYAVEETEPYNTNTVDITTNEEDRVFGDETSGTTSDPVLNYVYLGDSLADGLLAWVTVAVDMSAEYSPAYSYVWTEEGSEAVEGHGDDTVNGGGGDFPGGTGGPGGLGAPTGVPTGIPTGVPDDISTGTATESVAGVSSSTASDTTSDVGSETPSPSSNAGGWLYGPRIRDLVLVLSVSFVLLHMLVGF
ncbi:Intradiol ring-cleavage dioxygenase [Aspergillus granulosus]|uniref:Intradiol ring-cleavage dioxygenase n=1 Tax=Aspergillus granulosus TaxID=176169 RepID=A0ABR4H971_9EURO